VRRGGDRVTLYLENQNQSQGKERDTPGKRLWLKKKRERKGGGSRGGGLLGVKDGRESSRSGEGKKKTRGCPRGHLEILEEDKPPPGLEGKGQW